MSENGNKQEEYKRINAVKFLRETGLLFQINRDILHPLGLALEAKMYDDKSGEGMIVDLWDCRDEPEGIIYGEETLIRNEKKLKKFQEEFADQKIIERHNTLGFTLQFSKEHEEGRNHGLDFGLALIAAKGGHKILRKGWNGTGMFVVHQKAYPNGIPINKNTAEATGLPEGTVCQFLPYLMLKTKDNQFVPWTPNMIDVLAEDWTYISEESEA